MLLTVSNSRGKIHLIDSEGTRNKEQHFNCMKYHNRICSKSIHDLVDFVMQVKYSNRAN